MNYEIKINENLSLRLREESDAQAFFDLVDKNRDEFRKWLPWVDSTLSSEDSKKFILECKQEFEDKKSADFGVWYDGQWIGSMGFHTIKLDKGWAEIGYWLSEDFQGRGIMTESVKAIIDYGFNTLNLHRIQIRCDSDNLKSKLIPERIGFKLEGVTREDHKKGEEFSDGLIYGLLSSEWNNK